jgi:hypothetical protein
VALAQNTTTTVGCGPTDGTAPVAPATGPNTAPTGIPACHTDGKTLLVATFQEGLTLTVPDQINFALVPGTQSPGDKKLEAVTTWYLSADYSDLWVDAFFTSAYPLLASDPSMQLDGNPGLPYQAVLAQQNGLGGTNAFDIAQLAATDPVANEDSTITAAYPISHVSLASGNNVGSDDSYLNLFIDFTTTGPLDNMGTLAIAPSKIGGTWHGYVYIRAEAY